ncbi:winged helix-turn-helix domain-containing protein [Lysobacter fragariae]
MQIDDVRVDLRYRRVIRPDGEMELPQRMFDLLLVFLAEPHVLHNRADLFTRVWPGVIVEDANLSQSIWMLRKALGESRKHWIRTVAKGGYVLEPPGTIEPVVDAAAHVDARPLASSIPISNESPAASTLAEPGSHDASTVPAAVPDAPRTRPFPWLRRVALPILLLGAVGGVAWQLASQRPGSPPPTPIVATPQIAIALVNVTDKAAPEDARWPATVLRAWLGWKLGALPEVTLLNEAHLAADSEGLSPTVVQLSSSVDPSHPQRMTLEARFTQDGRDQRIERSGTRAQMPTLVDELSNQLLARLLPKRTTEKWPALNLDVQVAPLYASSVDAVERRDWPNATKMLDQVTRQSPKFGLARLQLGGALARQASGYIAVEQTQNAIDLLHPVPADVAEMLNATLLGRDPSKHAESAQAWGRLARRHPGKVDYVLEQARKLIRAGQSTEALRLLNQPYLDKQPVGYRLTRLLNISTAHLNMGDVVRGREFAQASERVARSAGKGWELELGEALLLRAQADQAQFGEDADLATYELAAQQFESAGDTLDALFARYLAESGQADAGSLQHLDELLAQARARGFRNLEVDMLRLTAFRYYSQGDMEAYRARLEQALATALSLDDPVTQQSLELDLANEDLLRGRLDSVQHHLASMQARRLEGGEQVEVTHLKAVLMFIDGDLKGAQTAVEDAIRKQALPGGRLPVAATQLACVHADLLMNLGDAPGSRNEWTRCADGGQPDLRLQSQIANGLIDMLTGERTSALQTLAQSHKQMSLTPDGPDRWFGEIWLASLDTRVGDPVAAQRTLMRVLPLAERSGYGWIATLARVALAESAAARGDWAEADGWVAKARQEPVSRVWVARSRLDLVETASAMARGDQATANTLLAAVHQQAHDKGDIGSQLEIHSLMRPGTTLGQCDDAHRAALVARTGMRGATLDWLRAGINADTRQRANQLQLH